MEYLGKMLGAGQLASGSLVHHSAVKETIVQVQHTHWAVKLWPGTRWSSETQHKSAALLASELVLTSVTTAGFVLRVLPGRLGVSSGVVNRKNKGNRGWNYARCFRLQGVDRHMVGVSCSACPVGIMGPQLQYVTALNGDCLTPSDAWFAWEEKLISYLSPLIYGCHHQRFKWAYIFPISEIVRHLFARLTGLGCDNRCHFHVCV